MAKRQLKTWLAGALGIVVLVTVAFLIYGYHLRREARSVLDDVSALTSAPDRDAAFATMRQKYGNRLTPDEGCSADICSYQVTVSNRPLSALFRVPYTELNARFDLRGKSVVLVYVEYRSAQTNRESPVIGVQTDFKCGSCDFFGLNPWAQSSSPERWNGDVEMGFASAPELRQAALSFNTNCLTKMRGCNDIAQLLPRVWSPTATGVRCVIANHEGKAQWYGEKM